MKTIKEIDKEIFANNLEIEKIRDKIKEIEEEENKKIRGFRINISFLQGYKQCLIDDKEDEEKIFPGGFQEELEKL